MVFNHGKAFADQRDWATNSVVLWSVIQTQEQYARENLG